MLNHRSITFTRHLFSRCQLTRSSKSLSSNVTSSCVVPCVSRTTGLVISDGRLKRFTTQYHQVNRFSSSLGLPLPPLQAVKTVKLKHEIFEPSSTSHQPPIVFLHGLFGSKKNWESIAKALCRKLSRKIITVDARNHGDSPHSNEMNYIAMAADTMQLLRKDLLLSNAVIVGHSMGGKTAMTLALLEPSLVERLVIEDIAPEISQTGLRTDFIGYLHAMQAVKFDQSSASLSAVRRTVGEELKHVFPEKPLRDFMLTNIDQRNGQYCWRVNLSAIDTHIEDIVGFPESVPFFQYTGPTLFIGGALSPNVAEPSYKEIRRLFAMPTVSHIAGAGHWVHSEKPAEFMKLVENFVLEGAR